MNSRKSDNIFHTFLSTLAVDILGKCSYVFDLTICIQVIFLFPIHIYTYPHMKPEEMGAHASKLSTHLRHVAVVTGSLSWGYLFTLKNLSG